MKLAEYETLIETLEASPDREDAGFRLRGVSQDIRSCAWNGTALKAARELAARADASAAARGMGAEPLPIHGSTGITADGSYRYGGRL